MSEAIGTWSSELYNCYDGSIGSDNSFLFVWSMAQLHIVKIHR